MTCGTLRRNRVAIRGECALASGRTPSRHGDFPLGRAVSLSDPGLPFAGVFLILLTQRHTVPELVLNQAPDIFIIH